MVGTLVSVEEYLSTSYSDGDREYVDGEILERNLGEIPHGSAQGNIYHFFRNHYGKILWAGIEIRVQVKASRFRVPDVLAVLGPMPAGAIITAPPFLVVEVLSKDDRADDIEEKIDDYLAFGVGYVWILNPRTHDAHIYTAERREHVTDGVLSTANPEIVVPFSEIF
jgi:Uma2 family endonuclease